MFIFNNICSENMDLIVEELPPISTAEEKINSIDIPGMDGALLQSDGLEMLEKKVVVHYTGDNPDRLIQWLRGGGKVIFGNIKDRYYKSYITNKIPLEEVLRNQLYYFPIIFTCKPCGYLLEGDYPIDISNGTVLYNGKNSYRSLPKIIIQGSGSATITINNRTFKITDIGGNIIINSENEKVLDSKGKYMEGEFPYLDIGENKITWTGNITSMQIIPYWRTRI